MGRLIDADELKEIIRWSEVCRLSTDEIKKIIDEAPTVKAYPFEQVVELIEVNHRLSQEIEKMKRGEDHGKQ